MRSGRREARVLTRWVRRMDRSRGGRGRTSGREMENQLLLGTNVRDRATDVDWLEGVLAGSPGERPPVSQPERPRGRRTDRRDGGPAARPNVACGGDTGRRQHRRTRRFRPPCNPDWGLPDHQEPGPRWRTPWRVAGRSPPRGGLSANARAPTYAKSAICTEDGGALVRSCSSFFASRLQPIRPVN